ncbi:hypothetical protein [Nostoc sp. ChiVER01]|uniref:hypothetical protein n=1 Tax=Nostoc sp. ChiVER01 TaxID=3075382 RepID=UPI002AD591DE|nr:hypothetical protein [Nostoc sp. ChiVER01]MDZ8222546.1 hypothetical protein [Nostoc sp. ChiVER01]
MKLTKIIDFFKYTFLGEVRESESSIEIAELSEDNSSLSEVGLSFRDYTRSKIIILINWVLMIVCLSCFVVIIIYSLFLRSEKIPDIIQNTFSLSLGWFGSSLVTFLESKPK